MYKIIYCEDNDDDIEEMTVHIKKLEKSLHLENKLTLDCTSFDNVLSRLNNNYDLLILDWVNKNNKNPQGCDILSDFSNLKEFSDTKVIIYSGTGKNKATRNISTLIQEYSNVQVITKSDDGSFVNILEKIETLILEKIGKEEVFEEHDTDDDLLQLLIKDIGHNTFKNLLYKLRRNSKETYIVSPMSQGYSEAHVFRLKLGNKYSVVKIAKTSDSFDEEINKAKKMYGQFPDTIQLSYDAGNVNTVTESGYTCFQIKYKKGDSLFKTIATTNRDKIKTVLGNFFLNGGFSEIYKNEEFQQEPKTKYTYMFEQYKKNKYRIYLLKSTKNELKSIISKYNLMIGSNFNQLKLLLETCKYDCIDANELLDSDKVKYNKNLFLSHRDLHSKNIIIDDYGNPFIIDTGRLGHDYWCIDICRLVVDLFIYGLHCDTFKFYDYAEIENDLVIADKIINQNVDDLDTKNNFLFSLKWLTENLEEIYGKDLFTSWEYKLGLLIEFVKVACRKETTPPNKRVIALVSAYKCMISANKELEENKSK